MRTDTWPTAVRWVSNIKVASHDDVAGQIAEYLRVEWDFEDLEVLWHSAPEFTGESYIIHDVEIRYSWGYTDDFSEKHGS